MVPLSISSLITKIIKINFNYLIMFVFYSIIVSKYM